MLLAVDCVNDAFAQIIMILCQLHLAEGMSQNLHCFVLCLIELYTPDFLNASVCTWCMLLIEGVTDT